MGVANCSMNGADEAKIKHENQFDAEKEILILPTKIICYMVWSKNHSGLGNVVPIKQLLLKIVSQNKVC